MEVIWETFCSQGDHITWHGGHMWRMCEICCKYGIWLGVPGESSYAHWRVITSRRGPLATSKQIAGRPENRKTEIRTPHYARRQDRQLQNGTEWQEDKIGTKIHHSRVPRGAGGFILRCMSLLQCQVDALLAFAIWVARLFCSFLDSLLAYCLRTMLPAVCTWILYRCFPCMLITFDW